MGGAVKSVSNIVSSVVNGFTTGNPTPSGGGGEKSFWDDPLGNTFRWAGDTVKAVIENPLPVIETIGLTMLGVPSPVASSMVAAMNGGDMGQIITAGVTSYIGQEAGRGIGNFAGDVLGASTTTAAIVASASGANVGATLNGLANGKSFSDSLASGLTAGAFAGANSAINLGINAAATELNTPTPNTDNLNISPLSSVQPDVAPTNDYSVKADYSLGSTATPKFGVDPMTGTGLTANPMTNGAADVGYTPVDYGLVGANAGLGLQMPSSPAIKAMGGGQGLTTNVTNPVTGETGVVGGLGYTPTGAAPVLGNPSSFINNPNVTGQPVMSVDPAYYDVTPPKVSVSPNKTTTESPLTSTLSGTSSGTGMPKSTYQGSPLQSADSYLTTSGATNPFELAQLKQLFPSLTPDMAKILMERTGVTPSMFPNTNFLTPSESSKNDSDLSAVELANFGQPDEVTRYAAKGGSMRLPKGHHPEFITGQTGHYAQGRGTGQSDDIPAVLRDGDYVVDADTVAAFGDGSSKAGAGALEHFRRSIPEHHSGGGQPIPAKIADGEYVLPAGFVTSLGRGSNKQGAKMLDAMREQIRAHKRSAPDTKIPPKAKSPLQYMNEAMKG